MGTNVASLLAVLATGVLTGAAVVYAYALDSARERTARGGGPVTSPAGPPTSSPAEGEPDGAALAGPQPGTHPIPSKSTSRAESEPRSVLRWTSSGTPPIPPAAGQASRGPSPAVPPASPPAAGVATPRTSRAVSEASISHPQWASVPPVGPFPRPRVTQAALAAFDRQPGGPSAAARAADGAATVAEPPPLGVLPPGRRVQLPPLVSPTAAPPAVSPTAAPA
jgi:hypothetical protein